MLLLALAFHAGMLAISISCILPVLPFAGNHGDTEERNQSNGFRMVNPLGFGEGRFAETNGRMPATRQSHWMSPGAARFPARGTQAFLYLRNLPVITIFTRSPFGSGSRDRSRSKSIALMMPSPNSSWISAFKVVP